MKTILIIALQFLFLNSGLAADLCSGCDQLKNVEVQLRAKNKPSDYYNSLQLKASEIIAKMPAKKDLKLTSAQVVRVAEVIQLSTQKDPSESIIQSNISIIAANAAAIKKQFAKLPKKRAEDLKNAIDMSVNHLSEGDDPTAEAKD